MIGEAPAPAARRPRPPAARSRRSASARPAAAAASSEAAAPRRCRASIFKVDVEEGAEVDEGDLICVIEAMKMENEITAHRAGKVTELPIAVGDAVASGDTLVTIE